MIFEVIESWVVVCIGGTDSPEDAHEEFQAKGRLVIHHCGETVSGQRQTKSLRRSSDVASFTTFKHGWLME
jgi:hypothetical protein